MSKPNTKSFRESHSVSKMTLARWRQAGHVVVTPDGAIDAEATDARLAAAGLGRFREPPAAVTSSLADEQRRREVALARLRRQEWLLRSAEYMTRADAEAVRAAVVTTGPKAEALVPMLVAQVARCTRMGEIKAAIHDAVFAWLQTASGTDVVATTGPAMPPPPPIRDDISKIEADTIKTAALANLRQLDFDISTGAVISITEVDRLLGAAVMQARSRLLALEARLPPVLLGLPAAEAESIIGRAIDEAMNELPRAPIWPAPASPGPAATPTRAKGQKPTRPVQ